MGMYTPVFAPPVDGGHGVGRLDTVHTEQHQENGEQHDTHRFRLSHAQLLQKEL